MADDADDALTIAVDGETFTMDALTFRERREVRRVARELAEDPEADLEDIMIDDVIVAFATICKRRVDPDYSTEAAMDLKPDDLIPSAPPTKPARRKAKAAPASK